MLSSQFNKSYANSFRLLYNELGKNKTRVSRNFVDDFYEKLGVPLKLIRHVKGSVKENTLFFCLTNVSVCLSGLLPIHRRMVIEQLSYGSSFNMNLNGDYLEILHGCFYCVDRSVGIGDDFLNKLVSDSCRLGLLKKYVENELYDPSFEESLSKVLWGENNCLEQESSEFGSIITTFLGNDSSKLCLIGGSSEDEGSSYSDNLHKLNYIALVYKGE